MILRLLTMVALCSLLPSCDSKPKANNVVIEAADYTPIGEGIKYLSLSLLGGAVVFSIASMVNNGKGDHD